MKVFTYTKTPVSLDRLFLEISNSSITIAVDIPCTSMLGEQLTIAFKADLPDADKTALDAIVAAHTGEALADTSVQNVVIQSQPAITVESTPPFGAKTIVVGGVVKKLYARYVGFQQALTVGENTISYTATFPWAKVLGVEAINCEALDVVDFAVYDTPAGTYSGVPNLLLNQFGFSTNLPKDYYERMAKFDADLYAGMIIKVKYTSVSAKTIGINIIMDEVK
jgi:hypothetical protein